MCAKTRRSLGVLEEWMRSYKPDELFDEKGRLRPDLKALAPSAQRRMSANPHANGGLLRKELKLPDFRSYAVDVAQAGKVLHENTKPLGEFLRDVMRNNMNNFRVFGPDETASNRLQAIYDVSKKTLDRRLVARGCGWRPTGARRTGHGNALGAHAPGVA